MEITLHLPPKKSINQTFSVRKIKGWNDRDFIKITGSCKEGELFYTPEETLVFDTTPKPATMRKAFVTVTSVILFLMVISALFSLPLSEPSDQNYQDDG